MHHPLITAAKCIHRQAHITLVAALGLAPALAGCGGMPVMNALQTVESVRSGVSNYHAMTSVKDLTELNPYFAGYDSVRVAALMAPGENQEAFQVAFAANLERVVADAARATQTPLTVCSEARQCSGRTMLLQFTEDAYDRNIVQRLSVGHKLRGTLRFVDATSAETVGEKRLEIAKDYAALAVQSVAMIKAALLAGTQATSEHAARRQADAMNAIPAVYPEYEPVIGRPG